MHCVQQISMQEQNMAGEITLRNESDQAIN